MESKECIKIRELSCADLNNIQKLYSLPEISVFSVVFQSCEELSGHPIKFR
jgi:hypothetical protein